MQSRPSLAIETRVLLLISILFLAGISLPFDVLRQVESLPYQGGTYLFLSFLFALLQKPQSLQTLQKHPQEASNLLSYFARPENYNESYWWLQHKPQILNLFSDELTFLILAKSPWLFKPLHSLFDYSPSEFDKGLSNRTFFNDLLSLASDYPELKTILTSSPITMVVVIEKPSLLPRIRTTLNNTQIKAVLLQNPTLFPYFLFNPSLDLPTTQQWVLILQPANNTVITTSWSVLVLIHVGASIIFQNILNLFQNGTTINTLNTSPRPLNGTGTSLYNATLNPANITEGSYVLQASVTTYSPSNTLTYQIVLYLARSIVQPVIHLAEETA